MKFKLNDGSIWVGGKGLHLIVSAVLASLGAFVSTMETSQAVPLNGRAMRMMRLTVLCLIEMKQLDTLQLKH